MRTLGFILLVIGIWQAGAYLVVFPFDPAGMRAPVVQSTVADGLLFLALGAGVLLLDWLSSDGDRAETTTPPPDGG